jgi:putative CRISPR-associated protein (TIGR02620 family)
MTDTVVVTRHKALVEFLIETKRIPAETPVLSHVTSKDVEDKHVIGVLPLHLAALAATVTEVPLDIPAELRGKELDLEQVRQFAGDPVKYSVRKEADTRLFAYNLGNMVAEGSDNWLGCGTEDDVLRFNGLS